MMMRRTLRSAICRHPWWPAAARRWKYAGTVITASVTFSPRCASAASFSFRRINAEISGGEYCLPRTSTHASPFAPGTTL